MRALALGLLMVVCAGCVGLWGPDVPRPAVYVPPVYIAPEPVVVVPYYYSPYYCYGCAYGYWGGQWGYHRGGGFHHGGRR